MDDTHYTTEHRKGQYPSCEERHDIEVHRKDGWSINKIAEHLGRPYNTIKNEIARGTVTQYGGKVKRYKAEAGQKQYEANRHSSARQFRVLEVLYNVHFILR